MNVPVHIFFIITFRLNTNREINRIQFVVVYFIIIIFSKISLKSFTVRNIEYSFEEWEAPGNPKCQNRLFDLIFSILINFLTNRF